MIMGKESGEIASDREKNSKNMQRPSVHTRKYNEIDFTKEAVERAIKRIKRHKAHGMDEITK